MVGCYGGWPEYLVMQQSGEVMARIRISDGQRRGFGEGADGWRV